MDFTKLKQGTRCADCGLDISKATDGRCPRCGAHLNASASSFLVLPYADLINPYEAQYYSIRDEVMEGGASRSTMGDFLVSMEDLADDGDDMAQHFLGRFVYLEKDIKYAHELLEKSAAKGNFLAENDLGVMYQEAIAFRETIMQRFAFTVSQPKKGIRERW